MPFRSPRTNRDGFESSVEETTLMTSKRPKVLKTATRAASGGVILVGAVLMLLFFRGGGLGVGVDSPGESEDSGTQDTATTEAQSNISPDLSSVASPEQKTPQPKESESTEPKLTIDEQVATGQKTLGILIDERSFLLRIPGTPQDVFRESTLERLVELAQMVPGDSNGIRVTILRRETARTTAEQELKRALEASGIGANAVYMPNDFVP